MRRLARHLFTLCSAASLVLGVAVCALWARSFNEPPHGAEQADARPSSAGLLTRRADSPD